MAISSIGIHTNLAALLRTPPDAISPLGGLALVAEKVSLLAVMGAKFPKSDGFPECNVCGGGRNKHNQLVASAASSYVAAHWPASSQLIWSGFEVGVQVSEPLHTSHRLHTDPEPLRPSRAQAKSRYARGAHRSRAVTPVTRTGAERRRALPEVPRRLGEQSDPRGDGQLRRRP